jgi:Xaa-Pro aminopeptidase
MFPPITHHAYLICNPVNIRYLTGFLGAEPSAHEVYVLITQTTCFLFTNSLYIERAREIKSTITLDGNNLMVKVIQISRTNSLWKQLKNICKTEKINQIEFEDHDLYINEYFQLKNALRQIKFKSLKIGLDQYRSIKNKVEITNIRKAVKITDLCFNYLLSQIKSDITEKKLAQKIDIFIRRHNAIPAFDPIVAFESHTSQPHYLPDQTKLTKNNLILCDFGTNYNGYTSDMTRMFYFGKPPQNILKAYQTVLKAQEKTIGMLSQYSKPCYSKIDNSYSGACLDRVAKNVIKKAGYIPYSHSLGHGIGLSIHEDPRLSLHKDMKIRPGMVFSLEPAIYITGEFGIRIEDTIYLSDDGLEILTKSPKNIVII